MKSKPNIDVSTNQTGVAMESANKLSLYGIAKEFEALEEMIYQDNGEVTEDHEELANYVNNLLTQKTDNFVSFVQKLEDEAEIAANHIKRIQAYKKARENAVERLKTYAHDCLEKLNTAKIEGTMGSIAIRKPATVVLIENEDDIPEDFASYSRSIDKTKVKDALKSGAEIPGARLADGKKSIQFKMKGVK
jgi:hypothetical protein